MANGWTPARKARQATLIRSWRPWEKSTGPRTKEGKELAKMNRYQGGRRPAERELIRALREALAENLDGLREIREAS